MEARRGELETREKLMNTCRDRQLSLGRPHKHRINEKKTKACTIRSIAMKGGKLFTGRITVFIFCEEDLMQNI